VDLLCSKPIVPDSRTTSLEFVSLLGKLIQNREAAYAKILLEKCVHLLFRTSPVLARIANRGRISDLKKCCLIGV
jgi:hypothetical protein